MELNVIYEYHILSNFAFQLALFEEIFPQERVCRFSFPLQDVTASVSRADALQLMYLIDSVGYVQANRLLQD